MARWKLKCSHYLITATPAVWEQKEIDRGSGKEVRKKYQVPALFDINDPSHWNVQYRGHNGQVVDGDIVVCDGADPQPGDIIFVGQPTPDMEPLDEAAEKKSAEYASKWNHPIDSLPGTFGDSLIAGLQAQIADAKSKSQAETKIAGMDELLAGIKSMMETNAALIAALTAAGGARRV